MSRKVGFEAMILKLILLWAFALGCWASETGCQALGWRLASAMRYGLDGRSPGKAGFAVLLAGGGIAPVTPGVETVLATLLYVPPVIS